VLGYISETTAAKVIVDWVSVDNQNVSEALPPFSVLEKPENVGYHDGDVIIGKAIECCGWSGARTREEHGTQRFVSISPFKPI
jgi:hypothetical protein